ncbi:MAG: DUF4835 family protein [Bacteroidetes bacterium]|nr:DUF4835 family protein [Bacteroidota bacterium]
MLLKISWMQSLKIISKYAWGFLIPVAFILTSFTVSAQELNCSVQVNDERIATSDRQVFRDMEIEFAQFLNSRRWSDDVFQDEERIKCNLSITLDDMPTIGSFSATVQIQAARPVFNSNYESIVLNFADRDWTFQYVQSLPLDFNDNAYSTNLTSMLAFYADIIIGMDYDTFEELGGTRFYQKAQNIVTNATQSLRPGWSSLESNRNRFWMIENLMNQRMVEMRKGMYKYHRLGLDTYQDQPDEAQKNILEVLKKVSAVRKVDPNAIIVIAFLDAKRDELVNIFSTGNIQVRRDAYNLLVEMDPSKRDKYSRIISN